MNIVILGLSITSAWGNGHATTFRGLVKALHARGHEVLFLERDQPWYRSNRDLAQPPYCRLGLYDSLDDLAIYAAEVASADLVMVGSYVPDGVQVADWAIRTAEGTTAFYDIDTPVTLAKLAAGDYQYLIPQLIPRFDYYLSFTGGPTLELLEQRYGSPAARPFYCSVDPELYYPESQTARWDLGYLGTYSVDRQPTLQALLLEPAAQWSDGRFVVAGPQYPESIRWPENVQRLEHCAPAEHRSFYNAQRFTLNVTRRDMIRAGWSPSVRIFEAAACGVPILSDYWDGLDDFLTIGEEILVARTTPEAREILQELPAEQRVRMAAAARTRVLAEHTADHRAQELEALVPGAIQPRGAAVSGAVIHSSI